MGEYYSRILRRRLLAGDEPEWLQRHPRRRYIRQTILATPEWADRKALHRIHLEARRRTATRGSPYVRDHIVPLTHYAVCGLNVPWNLRIIPFLENAQRSNRWWEYTPDLFAEPEQLCLL